MTKELVRSLTPAYFYILLSLSIKPRHGYEIMKQVSLDSNNKVNLGPGTLYGAIKKLLEEGLIKEIRQKENLRRRYYSITQKGGRILNYELERYQQALEVAKRWNILPIFKLEVS